MVAWLGETEHRPAPLPPPPAHPHPPPPRARRAAPRRAAGCNACAVECNGRTATHLAAREGHSGVLQLLFESMAPDVWDTQASRV
jgi:hypothetical protein